MSDVAISILSTVGLIAGIIGAIYGVWRRVRPGMQRSGAAIDALLGKEAVLDRSGAISEQSRPGLVHRVTTVEEAVVAFQEMVGLLVETQHMLSDHGSRLKVLEDIRVDKLVSQVESANMWGAVANANAPAADPAVITPV